MEPPRYLAVRDERRSGFGKPFKWLSRTAWTGVACQRRLPLPRGSKRILIGSRTLGVWAARGTMGGRSMGDEVATVLTTVPKIRPQVAKMPLQARMEAWDFFSGCGGTSAGFRKAGMDVRLGLDIDPEAARTFRRNFPEARFVESDIRAVSACSLDQYLRSGAAAGPLVFAACAPCQPFSRQNRLKRADDMRSSLLRELRRFISRFRPDYVFVENVPGMQHGCLDGKPFQDFVAFLRSLRYGVDYAVLEALDFGVPQRRSRLILTASRHGSPGMPAPSHGSGREPYQTVWDAIGQYPCLQAGEVHDQVANHAAPSLSPITKARLRSTPEGGGRRDWPQHLVLDCHQDHDGHSDVYGRLHRARPSGTLTTRCISVSNGRFAHPTQDRSITPREAAALQTFPDSFVFEGGTNSVAKQIGNAVSVKLAQAFGEHFVSHWASR